MIAIYADKTGAVQRIDRECYSDDALRDPRATVYLLPSEGRHKLGLGALASARSSDDLDPDALLEPCWRLRLVDGRLVVDDKAVPPPVPEATVPILASEWEGLRKAAPVSTAPIQARLDALSADSIEVTRGG